MYKLYRKSILISHRSDTSARESDGPLVRYCADACVHYSLPQQAAAAVVQQVSSVIIQQVFSAATLDLACGTRKRRPPDNQPRKPDRAAPTA
jgi:hypothetical protein